MQLSDLPMDVLGHIYEYADPETTWIADKVAKINANTNGWMIGRNVSERKFKKQDYLDIMDAMKRIPEIITPGRQYKINSYGGKHVLEKHRKKYMSNGCFICAMILLGYTYKKPDSLNLIFKAKYIK
jgi:hypothetical protein